MNNGTLFWALDGQKEMLEKDVDDVTGEYVKCVFDREMRCDIEGFADGTKQVQINTRPIFNSTNLVDTFFFGTGLFRQTLSDYLKDLADRQYAISIDRPEDHGRAITVVVWSEPGNPPKRSGLLWFDTKKNAIIRREGNVVGGPEVVYTVDELREASPNLWLPATFAVTVLESFPSGESRWTKRMTYTTRDLQVNSPVDASLFDTTPPRNSFVNDAAHRELYPKNDAISNSSRTKLEPWRLEDHPHTLAKIVIPNPTPRETISNIHPMISVLLIPYTPADVC